MRNWVQYEKLFLFCNIYSENICSIQVKNVCKFAMKMKYLIPVSSFFFHPPSFPQHPCLCLAYSMLLFIFSAATVELLCVFYKCMYALCIFKKAQRDTNRRGAEEGLCTGGECWMGEAERRKKVIENLLLLNVF